MYCLLDVSAILGHYQDALGNQLFVFLYLIAYFVAKCIVIAYT